MKNKTISFIKENKFLFFLFIFSTAFFILQHVLYISWDYSVYELNARYWFSNGNYFEILRPPITPLLIGVLSLFNFYSFGKYAYLAFVSLLYFIICIKLAEKLKINKTLFYVLCLNPYVLEKAFQAGTELLALSFIMLFILFFLNERKGGIFLGLSFLTRYQALPFAALILFYKKFKNILLNALYFSIPIVIWLMYNYFTTGNPLTSLADSYAINSLSRKAIAQPANVFHILYAVNIMALFFMAYVSRLFNKRFRSAEKKDFKINLIMLLIAVITIYSYFVTPFKDVRYLFNLTLPFAYFSCKAFKKINKKAVYILGVSFFIYFAIFFINVYPDSSIKKSDFEKDIAELDKLGIKNCSIRSDVWPLLAYYGYSANFNKDYLNYVYVKNGEYLVLFPNYGEYDYKELNRDLIIKQTGNFVVLGNKSISCKPAEKTYHSYLRGFNESLYLRYNRSANINPYYVLFTKNNALFNLD